MTKTTAKKTKYNLWQNTAFMVRIAWNTCPSVIFIGIALALATTGSTVAELLLTPSILQKLETNASLTELLILIGIFSVSLVILNGFLGYLYENTSFGRIEIRTEIVWLIGRKLARTSYSNLLDTRFISFKSKAEQACSSNTAPTEAIWDTWVLILTDAMGFLIYLLLLSGLNPFLIAVVILTTTIGFFLSKRLNEWG